MKSDKRQLLLVSAAVACLLVMNGLIIFYFISNASIKSYQEATEPTEMNDDSDYEEDASEAEDVNQIIEDTGETEMDEVSEVTEDTQEKVLEETGEVSVPEEITAYYNFLSDILAQAYEVTDIYAAVTDGYDSIYYCKYGIADFDSDGVIDLILYSECWDEEGFRVQVSYGNSIKCYTYNYDSKEIEMTNQFLTIGYLLDSDCVFYGNGTVYKDEQYFNIDEDFYNEIGLLPATNSNGRYFDSVSGMLFADENGDSYAFSVSEDAFGVDEVKTVSYDEYQTIMNKLISDNVLDVTIYDFNAENIETLK